MGIYAELDEDPEDRFPNLTRAIHLHEGINIRVLGGWANSREDDNDDYYGVSFETDDGSRIVAESTGRSVFEALSRLDEKMKDWIPERMR